jgi:hypothetical protein
VTDAQLGVEPEEPKRDDAEPIIPEQPPTWIYWNPRDQLVIRQWHNAPSGEDDEPFLFFSVENVPALIAGLTEKLRDFDRGLAGHADTQQPAQDLAEPHEAKAEATNRTRQAPLSTAERQRRFRERRGGNENPSRRYEQSNGAALRGNETRTSGDENSLPGDVNGFNGQSTADA